MHSRRIYAILAKWEFLHIQISYVSERTLKIRALEFQTVYLYPTYSVDGIPVDGQAARDS
jgi:hypothetical protein